MKISHLFIKPIANAEMQTVETLEVENLQIIGQKRSQPFRAVLISSKSLLEYWDILPGSLRENVVIDDIDISELHSGDVLQIGDVQVRITFHCEPCKKMSHIANVEKLVGKRGALADFLCDGIIRIGDNLEIIGKQVYDPIPYEYYNRIAWYLDNFVEDTIMATDLLWQSGVAPGLIRVLPQILEKYDLAGRNKVRFAKDL